MKTYEIYLYNNGVYFFQKGMKAKLNEVFEYCKNEYSYSGYIKNDNGKILRRF